MEAVTAIKQRQEQDFSGIWSPAYRRLTLGLTLTVSFAAFEWLAVATTLPAVVKDLGGLRFYGWAFSAFMLANLVGIVIAGGEVDRQGLARPFVVGVTFFVAGLVLAGFAPTMLVVVAGRTVQGFGAGFISSVAYVSIGRGYPESAKPRMLAVLSSAWVVPGLVGPALAGFVADHAGWRWVFLSLAPLPPMAASLALSALQRLDPLVPHAPEVGRRRAALRLAAGTGLLLSGVGSKSLPVMLVLIALGAALLWPALQRLFPDGTLRVRPGLPAAIATMGLLNLAFFGVDAFLPLSLTAVRGQSLTTAGLVLTIATITWTAGAWLQAHWAFRLTRRLLVTMGLLLIAAGIAGAACALIPTVPAPVALVGWGVAGLGMGLAFATIELVVLETASVGQEGAAAASMQLAGVLGTALGTGFGGVMVGFAAATGGSPRSGIALVDVSMMAVAVLTVLAAARLPDGKC